MPKITAIERQRKAKEFLSIFVDGAYAFSLSEFEVEKLKLADGQELSAEAFSELVAQAGESKSYNLAVQYIGVRPRSAFEIRHYLNRKHAESIEATIERLKGNGLLNDVEFALAWIANRQALRPRSRRMLTAELQQKGVSSSDIADALAAVEPGSEVEAAMAVAEKKRMLGAYSEPAKLEAYLGRQGFRHDIIKKALERLDDAGE